MFLFLILSVVWVEFDFVDFLLAADSIDEMAVIDMGFVDIARGVELVVFVCRCGTLLVERGVWSCSCGGHGWRVGVR
jgi:hypothetical protein